MATRNQWQDEEEEKKTSLQSGVLGGASPTAGTAAANPSSWTNLQMYLDTNKGSGDAIADKTLEGTNQKITDTNTTVGTWADAAKGRVEAKKVTDDWSDKIKNSSVDDLNKLDRTKFDAWRNLASVWSGPADAAGDTGWGAAKGAVDQTKGVIDTANTWQGQQKMAQDTYGKEGRYSSGMGTLDAFVARGDAQGKFDTFKTNNANFDGGIGAKAGEVNTAIGGAKTFNKGKYDTVVTSVADRLRAIQGDQEFRAATQNRADAERLGSEFEQGLRDFQSKGGVSKNFQINKVAGDYLNTNKLTGADVATQAEIDALNLLGGYDDNTATGNYTLPGTRNANSFNKDKLMGDLQAEYDEWLRKEKERQAGIDKANKDGVYK